MKFNPITREAYPPSKETLLMVDNIPREISEYENPTIMLLSFARTSLEMRTWRDKNMLCCCVSNEV